VNERQIVKVSSVDTFHDDVVRGVEIGTAAIVQRAADAVQNRRPCTVTLDVIVPALNFSTDS